MTQVIRDGATADAAEPGVGFLWWVAAFAAVITVVELWERDVVGALFNGAVGGVLALQAGCGRRPRGWPRLALLALLGVLAVLTLVRFARLVR